MDIAGAYPADARLAHYRRMVRLVKGEAIEIIDSYAGERGAELSLMLCGKPELSDGRIRISDRGEIMLSGAGQPRVQQIEITDPRLRLAWPERIYRVLVPIEGRELRLRIE
jgi:hypothetical protein